MKLWHVRGREHGLRSGLQIFAVALGSYGPQQTCFLVPIKGTDREVDENAWGIRASYTNKPMLVANTDPSPGVILFLSSYNREGKSIGHIFVADDGGLGNVTSIGYGIGGTESGSVLWEESLVAVRGEAVFVLNHTGPPDAIVEVSNGQVNYRDVSQDELEDQIDAELVRIDDPRIARWKASNSAPQS